MKTNHHKNLVKIPVELDNEQKLYYYRIPIVILICTLIGVSTMWEEFILIFSTGKPTTEFKIVIALLVFISLYIYIKRRHLNYIHLFTKRPWKENRILIEQLAQKEHWEITYEEYDYFILEKPRPTQVYSKRDLKSKGETIYILRSAQGIFYKSILSLHLNEFIVIPNGENLENEKKIHLALKD